MELTNTGQKEEEERKGNSIRSRVNEFISGLGIIAGGTALSYKKQAVHNKYRNYLYPGFKQSGREAQAVVNQPGTELTTFFQTPRGEARRIKSPVIQSQLGAVSSLYPYVDTSKILIGQGKDVGSYAYTNYSRPEASVVLGASAGPFSLAHELGHIAAIQNPKDTLSKKLHRTYHAIRRNKDLDSQIKNYGIGGAALVGATSESLLGAIGKGALIGIGANAPSIGAEIAATHKGLKIMNKTGGPVPYGTGLAQVGNYISASILTPVAMSATAYGVKKTAEALMKKAKGNKQSQEQQPQDLVY